MIDRGIGEDGMEIATKLPRGRRKSAALGKSADRGKSQGWRRLWRATGKKSSERDVRCYGERPRSITHFFSPSLGAGAGSFGVTAMSKACIAARIELESILAMPLSPSRRP